MRFLISITILIFISINISYAWLREDQVALGLYDANPRRVDGTFDYRICNYSPGGMYEECKDLEMQKEIGKYWKEMKAFWFKFQDAVKKDDKETLATLMSYPLSVFYQPKPIAPLMPDREREILIEEMIVKDKQEFIKNYNFIFNPKLKKQIVEKPYRRLLVSKNVLKFTNFYSKVVMSKNCDPEQIPYEECRVIKVDYINNDAVLMEEIEQATELRVREQQNGSNN